MLLIAFGFGELGVYTFGWLVYITGAAAILLISAISWIPATWVSGLGESVQSGWIQLQEDANANTVVAGLIFLAGQSIQSLAGPPWVWDAIQRILEAYRQRAFKDSAIAKQPVHFHKVTIFRYSRFSWRALVSCFWHVGCWRLEGWLPWRWKLPTAGWLYPVCRSCGFRSGARVSFSIPRNLDLAEGFAGMVLQCEETVSQDNLIKIDASSPLEDVEKYGRDTFVSTAWIQRRLAGPKKAFPRTMHGFPIMIDGRLWGVIVLDSHDAKAVDHRALNEVYDIVNASLTELLRRIG